MNNPTPQITNTKFIELIKTYWAWRRLWIATTVVFGCMGLVYVLFLKNDMWTASQGLIVRDEANGAVMRLGRFQSQTEMKAAQETILEMARNTQVLREALLQVGPAKSLFSFNKISEGWPSQREVSELADEAIGVRAPQGAEFGTTEVIYLDIKQHTRDRALALNKAVCEALDSRLRQVRVARADGVINELVRASNMATDDLKKASERLQIIEREAGADLADLRGLSESNGSGSAARSQLENVKTEIRQVETAHSSLQSDLALLKETQADPERILSAPASILSAHPGLKKLREGLADAQLNSSQLRGRFTASHPLLFVATSAESEIKQQLQQELFQASSNSEREVAISQARLDKLKGQQQQLEERLERLARIRTEHEQLNQEVRSRTRILQDAEKQLADTRAARDAALSTSLLTRIDDPVLGERPVGPGRTTILAAMTMAGLCLGLGIVFLLTPLDGSTPDSGRWNEQLGRRLSDRFPWLADQGPQGAPRRRRNDVDRRKSTMGAERTANGATQGRRQSDQLTAAQSPTTSAPAIQEEDPSVASRLEDMLRSELAAMAPIAIERPQREVAQTPELGTIASVESASVRIDATSADSAEFDTSSSTETPMKPMAEQKNAAQQTTERAQKSKASSNTVERTDLVVPLTVPAHSISAPATTIAATVATESMKLEPEVAKPLVKPLTSAKTVEPVVRQSVSVEPSSIKKESTQPASLPSSATKIPEASSRTKEPIRPRLRVRDVPRTKPSASSSSGPSAKSKPDPRPERPAARPGSSSESSSRAPSRAASRPAVPPVSEPSTKRPVSPVAQSSAPPVMPTQPITPEQKQSRRPGNEEPARSPSQATPPSGSDSASAPRKTSRNLFKPNQALNTEAPQQSRPIGFQPPAEPKQPSPAPTANSFETPVEGGLAGIGLPTQKLPESFQFRQGT